MDQVLRTVAPPRPPAPPNDVMIFSPAPTDLRLCESLKLRRWSRVTRDWRPIWAVHLNADNEPAELNSIGLARTGFRR